MHPRSSTEWRGKATAPVPERPSSCGCAGEGRHELWRARWAWAGSAGTWSDSRSRTESRGTCLYLSFLGCADLCSKDPHADTEDLSSFRADPPCKTAGLLSLVFASQLNQHRIITNWYHQLEMPACYCVEQKALFHLKLNLGYNSASRPSLFSQTRQPSSTKSYSCPSKRSFGLFSFSVSVKSAGQKSHRCSHRYAHDGSTLFERRLATWSSYLLLTGFLQLDLRNWQGLRNMMQSYR